ncbi:hypothetical protein PUR49_07940 [Streptomyces sp. BE147]|uniref:hypothetical protein n=1 Tax=Streptomyces sp. BE147 TaxID=3002524 RepID=UPI002E762ADE|nr:hypothetical protein [Streptomyces sp. BE147]MEE1736429.1 hypothetical protein [Streptomyces sp. BE147]
MNVVPYDTEVGAGGEVVRFPSAGASTSNGARNGPVNECWAHAARELLDEEGTAWVPGQ